MVSTAELIGNLIGAVLVVLVLCYIIAWLTRRTDKNKGKGWSFVFYILGIGSVLIGLLTLVGLPAVLAVFAYRGLSVAEPRIFTWIEFTITSFYAAYRWFKLGSWRRKAA